MIDVRAQAGPSCKRWRGYQGLEDNADLRKVKELTLGNSCQ